MRKRKILLIFEKVLGREQKENGGSSKGESC
jgi:hypothetical protein